MKRLRQQIAEYLPFNAQEVQDKALILERLSEENILTRANKMAHITVSAWIVSADRQQVLMAYHNLYQSWAWLGGHADGNADLKQVILQEIAEESGVERVRFLSEQIFSLEVLTVEGHIKRGEYVSSHLHLNMTYLLEADTALPLRHKPDENSQVAWLAVDSLAQQVRETWFVDNIYRKLTAKVAQYFA